MNTPEGGKRMRQTMIAKHGSEQKWRAWMRENSRKGGAAKTSSPKGFAAMDKDQVVLLARRGGLARKSSAYGLSNEQIKLIAGLRTEDLPRLANGEIDFDKIREKQS